MGTRDKRIDAYIANAADFARPILVHLRETVHAACPDCEETVKWSMPAFTYHGILCIMAAFKAHATFGFWKHELLLGPRESDAMGSFGRITAVKDLPPKKELTTLIKRAMKLNEDGVTAPRARPVRPRPDVAVPTELTSALARNRKARLAFEAFSPSHRREYLEWITEAKSPETRARRVSTAIEWMSEGKSRHWRYAKRAGD